MPMALAGEYSEHEWEPMETGPLDGTPVRFVEENCTLRFRGQVQFMPGNRSRH